jgi:DDE superfamily endonuclease
MSWGGRWTRRPPCRRARVTLRPAPPQNLPNRHEHEDTRAGALKLLAAFDTRSGQVYGPCDERKRQQEFIAFLEHVDHAMTAAMKTIHLVCDHVSTHHGKKVRTWLVNHARFVVHFTPVHCAWMNQVAQWLSILPRQRWRIVDVESKDHRRQKLAQCIREWNVYAHPFNWSTKSVAKVMAAAPAMGA